jgi:hypothetical protein
MKNEALFIIRTIEEKMEQVSDRYEYEIDKEDLKVEMISGILMTRE